MRRLLILLFLGVAGCVPAEPLLHTMLGTGMSDGTATPREFAAAADRFPVSVDGRWGYIDRSGEIVVAPRFEVARPFSEGRAAVRLDGVWGLIDPDGSLVAAPGWVAISDVHSNRARVTVRQGNAKRYGFVDADGGVVVAPDLIAAYDFAGGLAPVRASRRDAPLGIAALRPIGQSVATPWLLIGIHGRVVVEREADAVVSGSVEYERSRTLLFPFSRADDLFKGPSWGWFDGLGREVVAPRFQAVGRFADGLAPAAENDQFGFVDAYGEFQIQPRFDAAFAFSDSLARVMADERWGFVRADGTLAGSLEWDGALDASDGRAAVQRDSLWGYLSADGTLALPLRYAFATPFHNGLARVRDADGDAYIDTDGTVVWRGE